MDATELRKRAIALILAEREKQVAKGFDARHDSKHDTGELIEAALCYTTVAGAMSRGASPDEWSVELFDGFHDSIIQWPFEDEDYKPRESELENLVMAAALIVAEIERITNYKRANE